MNIDRKLSFGDEHGAVMITTAGEIISCYLLAAAWERLPTPPTVWVDALPRHLLLAANDDRGELRTIFANRQECRAAMNGQFWCSAIEEAPCGGMCPVCGSEMFFVFVDAAGSRVRLERLAVFESLVRLSELGYVERVHDHLLRAWKKTHDHVCFAELQHFSRGGGAHG